MIPVNRIKRWPFPGNSVPYSRVAATMDQIEGDEASSLRGALELMLGKHEAAKVFEIIKQLVARATDGIEGTPCIYFKDPLGTFIGIVEDEDDDDVTDNGAEGSCGEDSDGDRGA